MGETVNRLIKNIKDNFSSELKETQLLNQAEKTITNYFETLRKEIEAEIRASKSLSLYINDFSLVEFNIADIGIKFERSKDKITFDEEIEKDHIEVIKLNEKKESILDKIYIGEAGEVVSSQYPGTPFSVGHIDGYIETVFSDFLK